MLWQLENNGRLLCWKAWNNISHIHQADLMIGDFKG
jgi:hypothetical protein